METDISFSKNMATDSVFILIGRYITSSLSYYEGLLNSTESRIKKK